MDQKVWIRRILALRTFAYLVASPLESAVRKMRRQKALPPLWLRRHTGDPASFEQAAASTTATLLELDLLPSDGAILDIGCGCGAMAAQFQRQLSEDFRYLGFDVHEPSIRWCHRAFSNDRRFSFELAALESPYSWRAHSVRTVTSYRFPSEDASTDLVLGKSVFTHLGLTDCRHYLEEVRRVLKDDGRAFLTFFLFEGGASPPPLFPYPEDDDAICRWRRASRPEAAIAYQRAHLETLIDEIGFEIIDIIPGFWPGLSSELTGQDQIILAPARKH